MSIASPSFKTDTFTGFPSSTFPSLVNLVDNSAYWLQSKNQGQREILLKTDGKDLFVLDNWKGISHRDLENVFAVSCSRKPGGRGMGLFISKKMLKKAGWVMLSVGLLRVASKWPLADHSNGGEQGGSSKHAPHVR